MGTNPFDDLSAAVESLRSQVCTLAARVEELGHGVDTSMIVARLDKVLGHLTAPPPAEWESLMDAATSRRKGRGQLLLAIKEGTITAKRVIGRGGNGKWLLSVADLNKHFPAYTQHREKKKPKTQLLGFSDPYGSCPAAPGYRTPEVLEELFG